MTIGLTWPLADPGDPLTDQGPRPSDRPVTGSSPATDGLPDGPTHQVPRPTPQARIQDFLRGGGGWRHSQTPPPPWTLSTWRHPPSLGHWPCDVIHPPKNWKTPSHAPPLWTFPCDVIHIPRGGDRFIFAIVKKFVEKKNWWSRAGGGSRPPLDPRLPRHPRLPSPTKVWVPAWLTDLSVPLPRKV